MSDRGSEGMSDGMSDSTAGSASDSVSVLLVDDHATMRAGFRMILEAASITVVGEAATGEQAIHSVRGIHPDVVFMDVQMPDLDGIEATSRIRAELGESGPSIVIVTTFDRDDYLFAALDAGASGFLLKNASPEELVRAAQLAASGEALLAPEVTRRVIERYAGARAESPDVDLTEREGDVLRLLARAMSNSEIAAELYIGDATVKTHVSNVLLKLGARDRVAAAVWAHRNGFA